MTFDCGRPLRANLYVTAPTLYVTAQVRMAFDLGRLNDQDIVLNIALASTAVNGGAAQAAAGFTQVCTGCTPAAPRGNAVPGDYELEFTLNGKLNGGPGKRREKHIHTTFATCVSS